MGRPKGSTSKAVKKAVGKGTAFKKKAVSKRRAKAKDAAPVAKQATKRQAKATEERSSDELLADAKSGHALAAEKVAQHEAAGKIGGE